MKNRTAVILAVMGLALLTAGAAIAYVEQRVLFLAGVFLGAGAVVLMVLAAGGARNLPWQRIWSDGKRLGLAAVISLTVAVTFVAVNYLAAGLSWRWDVTRAKEHTLSPATTAFLGALDKDVRFSALYAGLPPSYLENLFREYARASGGRITTEIIDPISEIGYAAEFGHIIDGRQSKVVVRCGKERRDVDFSSDVLTEAQLTNALVRVTRPARRICSLAGHGEKRLTDDGDQGLTKLAALLEANNMVSAEVMLGVEAGVPASCDVLLVPGPRDELTAEEESQVARYLRRGGDALFLVENILVTTPDKPLTAAEVNKNPSLNRILAPFGVKVNDDIVVDLASHAGDDVGCPATRNYAKHKAITEGLDYTFYVRPRSISLLADRSSSVKYAPIVMTSDGGKSWGETDRTLKVSFDPIVDIPGPVTLAYVLMEEKTGDALSDTRVIVFTDADFLTNIYVDRYSNAQMGLNVISWLAETEAAVFVDPREVKVERLDLTSRQKRAVAAILFLMPLFIAAGGVLVWLRKR